MLCVCVRVRVCVCVCVCVSARARDVLCYRSAAVYRVTLYRVHCSSDKTRKREASRDNDKCCDRLSLQERSRLTSLSFHPSFFFSFSFSNLNTLTLTRKSLIRERHRVRRRDASTSGRARRRLAIIFTFLLDLFLSVERRLRPRLGKQTILNFNDIPTIAQT